MLISHEYYLELFGVLAYKIDLSGHFSCCGEHQTGLVCAGQTKQGNVRAHSMASLVALKFVLVCDVSHLGLISGRP